MLEAVLVMWLAIAEPISPPEVPTVDIWSFSLCDEAFLHIWKDQRGDLWLVTPESMKVNPIYREAFDKAMRDPGMVRVLELEKRIPGVLCVGPDEDKEET